MRPQSCKAKGRRLQQIIASDLLQSFPELQDDDVRSTSMGAHGEDVQLSPAARKLIPYSFEAKNQERLNLWAAISQAETNCPKDVHPAIVVKKNGMAPYVAIRWSRFLQLITPQESDETITLSEELEAIAIRLNQIAGRVSSNESMSDE